MTDDHTRFGDPEGTKSRAKDGSAAGERLTSAITKHMGVITGIEASTPWGKDEPGQQFANGENNDGYQVSSKAFFESVKGSGDNPGVGEAVSGVFDAVTATVNYVQGVDQGGAAHIRKAGEV